MADVIPLYLRIYFLLILRESLPPVSVRDLAQVRKVRYKCHFTVHDNVN